MKAILTWHSIDDSGSPISIPPAAFEGHVRWLTSGEVAVVPLEEIADVPENLDAVALTFDDGFASVASVAAPLLNDAGLPCTVFVVSGRTGRDNSWGGRPEAGIPILPLLSWDNLGALADAGVTIGAHTRDHPDLTRLSDGDIAEQLDACADEIETRLGRRPQSFAYPYGHVDDRSAKAVGARFACAVTADHDIVHAGSDRYLLPRLDMYYYQRPERLAAWGTPAFGRYLALRRAGRAARSLVSRWGNA